METVMFRRYRSAAHDSLVSSLHDQNSFYAAFIDDLRRSNKEIIIESPFITTKRVNKLLPIFRELTRRGVSIVVNTKPLDEQESIFHIQAAQSIMALQELGITVLFTGGHHRKIAIIDRVTVWEGSLNILSQNDSCEFMRRIHSSQLASQMLAFLGLEKFIV